MDKKEVFFIKNIMFDEPEIRRSPILERERKQAVYDLLERNYFRPKKTSIENLKTFDGPYNLIFKILENGQSIKILVDNKKEESNCCKKNSYYNIEYKFSLKSLKNTVRDYFHICESYYSAVLKLTPAQIETIDMARRGIHEEGTLKVMDMFDKKIYIDEETARRLFTLIFVLHIRG